MCVCVYEDIQCSISFLPKSHTYPISTFTLYPSSYPPLLVLAYPSRVLSCIKDKWKNVLHFLLSLYKRQHFMSFFILCYLLNLSVLVQIEHPGSFYSCIVVLYMEISLLMNQSSAMDPEWFLILTIINRLWWTTLCIHHFAHVQVHPYDRFTEVKLLGQRAYAILNFDDHFKISLHRSHINLHSL